MAMILLVDDNPAMLDAMAEPLQRAGHKTALAADGKTAVRLLEGGGYDLVITDLNMPEMDGLEVIRQLHRKHPALRIIAMSGGTKYDAASNLKVAQMFGAAGTLGKPFTGKQLVEAVSAVLSPAP